MVVYDWRCCWCLCRLFSVWSWCSWLLGWIDCMKLCCFVCLDIGLVIGWFGCMVLWIFMLMLCFIGCGSFSLDLCCFFSVGNCCWMVCLVICCCLWSWLIFCLLVFWSVICRFSYLIVWKCWFWLILIGGRWFWSYLYWVMRGLYMVVVYMWLCCLGYGLFLMDYFGWLLFGCFLC